LSEIENKDIDRIKSLIIALIKKWNPKTTRELINLVRKEAEIPEEQLFSIIQELQEEKKIQFDELLFPESTAEYVLSFRAAWYWLILFLSILTAFLVFAIPENLVPQIYARSFLGIVFVLYLPGYTSIKALYPISVPLKTQSIILDTIERIALSIGLSLAITPIVGLILYYTPFGLNLTPVTLSLLLLTLILATIAILREYQARRLLFLKRIIAVSEYEISDSVVNFFDIQGLYRKNRVLIKQIPVKEITSIESFGVELSITCNGLTYLFFMKNGSQSLSELNEKIRGMQ
jgi:hypothetical protein